MGNLGPVFPRFAGDYVPSHNLSEGKVRKGGVGGRKVCQVDKQELDCLVTVVSDAHSYRPR